MGVGPHGNRFKTTFFVTEKGGLKPPSLFRVNVQTVNIWAARVPSSDERVHANLITHSVGKVGQRH